MLEYMKNIIYNILFIYYILGQYQNILHLVVNFNQILIGIVIQSSWRFDYYT